MSKYTDIWLVDGDDNHYRPGRVPHGVRIERAVDLKGNISSVLYFGTLGAAVMALRTLQDCSACVDCLRCSRCTGCRNCLDCDGLSGAIRAVGPA